MRDPRLAEIEFLSALERGPMTIAVPPNMQEGGRFGLSNEATRSMLLHMIAEHLVNGPVSALDPFLQDNPIDGAQEFAWRDSSQMRAGLPVVYRISHKGRVYLWQRRDELRADRGREQFGILYDRRAWDREVAVQLLFATEDKPYSVLALDLDKFKSVNDTLGHQEGDRFLIRYLELVRDVVGERGDGYRLGGDEVMVSLPATTLDEAKALAEAIRRAVEAEFQLKPVQATTSIGVGTFTAPVEPKVATKFVDLLLYEAKDAGRNCVRAAPFVPEQSA